MYQNGTNTITQGCAVTGHIYMNYVPLATPLYMQPIISSWLQPNYILFFVFFPIFQDNHKAFKDGRYRSLYEINGPALSSGLQWPGDVYRNLTSLPRPVAQKCLGFQNQFHQ